MSSKTWVKTTIGAILAIGLGVGASGLIAAGKADKESSANTKADKNAKPDKNASGGGLEKCYGIVKKGMNDCGAHNHSCQGEAKTNSDPDEWIFLPKGSCNKIVGGSLKPKT